MFLARQGRPRVSRGFWLRTLPARGPEENTISLAGGLTLALTWLPNTEPGFTTSSSLTDYLFTSLREELCGSPDPCSLPFVIIFCSPLYH